MWYKIRTWLWWIMIGLFSFAQLMMLMSFGTVNYMVIVIGLMIHHVVKVRTHKEVKKNKS